MTAVVSPLPIPVPQQLGFSQSPCDEQSSFNWQDPALSDMIEQFSDNSAPTSHYGDSQQPDSTDFNHAFGGYAIDSGSPPAVTLNPSWTLPRRSNPINTMHLPQLDTAELPLADSAFNLSPTQYSQPPGLTSAVSMSPSASFLDTPFGNHLSLSQDAYLPFEGAFDIRTSSFPASAPAHNFGYRDMTFDQTLLDSPPIHSPPLTSMVGPVRAKNSSRSFPYSPAKGNSTHLGYSPDGHPAFQRKRSISMSAGDLHHAMMDADDPRPPMLRQQSSQPILEGSRASSPLKHRYPSSLALQSQMEQTPPPPARERRPHRRSTLQSVIADARLPSSPPKQTYLSTEQMLAKSLTAGHALEAINTLELYLKQLVAAYQSGASADGRGSAYITDAHIHLLRDLRARIKAEATSKLGKC